MKVCKECLATLPNERFHRDAHSKDGHRNICKDCVREYREEHREEIAKSKRMYYQQNREQLLDYQQKYDRKKLLDK